MRFVFLALSLVGCVILDSPVLSMDAFPLLFFVWPTVLFRCDRFRDLIYGWVLALLYCCITGSYCLCVPLQRRSFNQWSPCVHACTSPLTKCLQFQAGFSFFFSIFFFFWMMVPCWSPLSQRFWFASLSFVIFLWNFSPLSGLPRTLSAPSTKELSTQNCFCNCFSCQG